MQSLTVIKHFDIFEYGLLGFLLTPKGLMMNQLGFQGVKEAFGHGIIPTVAFPAHALTNTVLFQ
jgi:hypothetical protein